MLSLGLDLLVRGIWIHSLDHLFGFVHFAAAKKLTRRLRTELQEASQNNGRYASKGDEISPAVLDLGEAGTQAVGDELAKSDRGVVKRDHPTAIVGRGKFTKIQGLFNHWCQQASTFYHMLDNQRKNNSQ